MPGRCKVILFHKLLGKISMQNIATYLGNSRDEDKKILKLCLEFQMLENTEREDLFPNHSQQNLRANS